MVSNSLGNDLWYLWVDKRLLWLVNRATRITRAFESSLLSVEIWVSFRERQSNVFRTFSLPLLEKGLSHFFTQKARTVLANCLHRWIVFNIAWPRVIQTSTNYKSTFTWQYTLSERRVIQRTIFFSAETYCLPFLFLSKSVTARLIFFD